MFSRSFAPSLMLLMDAPSSPGLLVRPRRGRLEFGGEFVTGNQLAAAVLLAAGGAIVVAELELQSKPDTPYTPYTFPIPWR